jgi:mutual gliding-motility protein MglA
VAVVDFAERQLTLKLVYYGPPLSGKTSNLRALHTKVDQLNRGRLMTLDTRDDRTLFFDLLPMFFRVEGRTSSFSVRIKVYTVPGQPVHEATRKVVLAGTDGVVFVADSSPSATEANLSSWGSLTTNLAAFALDRVPIVVQYNKRDLPDRVALEHADRFGEPTRALLEACARKGEGVVETFFELVGRSWAFLEQDLQLADKLGIDSEAFRRSLAEHVGVAIDATMPK